MYRRSAVRKLGFSVEGSEMGAQSSRGRTENCLGDQFDFRRYSRIFAGALSSPLDFNRTNSQPYFHVRSDSVTSRYPREWHSFFLEIIKPVLRSYKNEISCAIPWRPTSPTNDPSIKGQPHNPARPSPPLMIYLTRPLSPVCRLRVAQATGRQLNTQHLSSFNRIYLLVEYFSACLSLALPGRWIGGTILFHCFRRISCVPSVLVEPLVVDYVRFFVANLSFS